MLNLIVLYINHPLPHLVDIVRVVREKAQCGWTQFHITCSHFVHVKYRYVQ